MSFIIENPKFVTELGVKIDKVHSVISFSQCKWLEGCIANNTRLSKESKNKADKAFFKLLNNSVYGKTMENFRNRVNIRLTTSYRKAIKWQSSPLLKRTTECNGLWFIEQHRDEQVMDKPIYIGTSVSDLSKLTMMNFH